MKRVAIALVVLALAAPAHAQKRQVRKLVEQRMAAQHIPGVAVAVVRQGKPRLIRGFGLASVTHNAPVTPDTVFRLASVTKQFTAAAILLLAEDGKLGLDDAISDHLDGVPEAWKPITIRHLLHHTSGLKNFTSMASIWENRRDDFTPERLIEAVAKEPLEFAPGERHVYCNTGYFLLGLIIEKASGKSFDEFLRERIFEPLQMHDTRLEDDAAVIPRFAEGYRWVSGTLQRANFVSDTLPFAAGGLLSTVRDMAKWDAALYDDRILSDVSREAMWTPPTLSSGEESDYGFGWLINEIEGRQMLSHSGGIDGFSTFIARLPEEGVTVIVLVNQEGGSAVLLARAIGQLYLPHLAPQSIEDDNASITADHRALLAALVAGNAPEERFGQELRAAFFPDGAAQLSEFLRSLGELRSVELLERGPQEGGSRHRYLARFGETAMVVRFVVSADDLVTGIQITFD